MRFNNIAFPFFGNHGTVVPWSRPSGAIFSTQVNFTPTGRGTATLTDNPAPLPLVLCAPQDGGNASVLTYALKEIDHISPPWTITVGAAAFGGAALGGQNFPMPLILYDSAANKTENVYWSTSPDKLSVSGGTVSVYSCSNPDADAPSGAVVTVMNADANNYGFAFPDYFAFFRVVNNGASLSFQFGPDGFLWEDLYSEPVGSFLTTIDKVGFGIDRFALDVVTNTRVIIWHWAETSP